MTNHNDLTLTNLIDRIFTEGGLLSELYGMEYREQQHHYALDVCRWLQLEQPSVAMLEGETGIGKSLAYLLPLAVHLSLTGQRALISTYTVHLIHQLNDDKEKVRRILQHLQLRPVTVANRLGRAQYISASRLLALAETTDGVASKQQLLALHKKISKQYGPHIYVKYWSENAAGVNPGDTASAIALTEHCSADDAYWYHADCEAASHSDIVLTSHTCSMLYARGIPVFKGEPSNPVRPEPVEGRELRTHVPYQASFDSAQDERRSDSNGRNNLRMVSEKVGFAYLITDEADRMPEAAESILRLRSSPRRISSILQELYEEAGWKSSDTKKACQSLLGLQQVLDETGNLFTDTRCVLSKELPAHASLNYIQSIKEVMSCLQPLLGKTGANMPSGSEASADKINAVKGFYQSLNNVLNDKKQANCIAWSPVNRQGSIAIDEPFAGLTFSKFVRGISSSGALGKHGDHQPPLSVMLTSGTLGLSGKSGLARYTPIRSALGLKESDVKIWGHYAPKQYGDIRFILAGEVARPFASDSASDSLSDKSEIDDARYNEAWLDYTARMLLAAVASGATLCLCPSFNEVKELQDRLADQSALAFHNKGTRLDNLIEQLQGGEIQAIVTPSAWEGVSIRQKNGRQLLKNIMVTRIPLQPPNEVTENTFVARYLEQGRGRDDALKTLYGRIRDRGLRKFQQGLIGRGIRANNDSITAWVADPRIGPDRQHRLKGVIPERFASEYQNARLFGADGVITRPAVAKPREVLAWL
ncbi:helicase C-terminal domain-containing protein [Endozoicomonas acroporae]|uniref:helicase C-terminal domain-containing protein n=1 Tax=Endozoicomonas acroporae TaxID=1701104 RepID=UPI0013D74FE1|nr:helicase C-terminal domain-containing protein [Endozoicomonas acroporae]